MKPLDGAAAPPPTPLNTGLPKCSNQISGMILRVKYQRHLQYYINFSILVLFWYLWIIKIDMTTVQVSYVLYTDNET